MDNDTFTFIVCHPFGHSVESRYCSRTDADKHFNDLIVKNGGADYIAYYAPSSGGQINAWHNV